jgi:hypothetical protein
MDSWQLFFWVSRQSKPAQNGKPESHFPVFLTCTNSKRNQTACSQHPSNLFKAT